MLNRRVFLKSAAGTVAALTGIEKLNAQIKSAQAGEPNSKDPNGIWSLSKYKLPLGTLGKTGVKIPCLGLGTNALNNRALIRGAFLYGVTFWDTSNNYVGGNSEQAIGEFLEKNSSLRKSVFISTKAGSGTKLADLEPKLTESLKRMKTDFADLYLYHGVQSPAEINDELKQWAEARKKKKQFRFFGFSTHTNMADCINAAIKTGWIDAVLTTYNFRLMQDKNLLKAIDAAAKSGIGILAMKTMAKRPVIEIETEEDKKIVNHFLEKGFTKDQAKIKAVLENESITSACVGMGSVEQIQLNVGAVLDKQKLTSADKTILSDYASKTCDGFCAGCADICAAAVPSMPYVADVMRCLMYYNSYGMPEMAKEHYRNLPAEARARIARVDYSLAEKNCPNMMPIAKLMAEATEKLA